MTRSKLINTLEALFGIAHEIRKNVMFLSDGECAFIVRLDDVKAESVMAKYEHNKILEEHLHVETYTNLCHALGDILWIKSTGFTDACAAEEKTSLQAFLSVYYRNYFGAKYNGLLVCFYK